MWTYEKRLQYPVNIKTPNPMLAKVIITQFGGPHGELGASQRYLSQRYSMPYGQVKGVLTDIGTEELLCGFFALKTTRKVRYSYIGRVVPRTYSLGDRMIFSFGELSP